MNDKEKEKAVKSIYKSIDKMLKQAYRLVIIGAKANKGNKNE